MITLGNGTALINNILAVQRSLNDSNNPISFFTALQAAQGHQKEKKNKDRLNNNNNPFQKVTTVQQKQLKQ